MWSLARAWAAAAWSRAEVRQAAASSGIFAACDGAGQLVERRNASFSGAWDTARTARMAAFGAIFSGAVAYRWFKLLERMLPCRWCPPPLKKPGRQPSSAALAGGWHAGHPLSCAPAIAQKTAVHSLVYAPLHLSAFNAFMALTEGGDGGGVRAAIDRVVERTPRMWVAGSAFWIPVTVFNFAAVRPGSRALVTASCNLVWVTYLSLNSGSKSSKGRPPPPLPPLPLPG